MASIKMINEVSDEIRVKNEPICDSLSVPERKSQSKKVKEEPIDIDILRYNESTSKEAEIKTEKKFSVWNEERPNTTASHDTQKTSNKLENSKDPRDKRRYKCDYCGKSFIAPSLLEKHRRIHTGEKPYECDICQKRFNQSGNLKLHRRIHTGEKLYNCNICQKRFIQLSGLIAHLRIHSEEKPFECDFCKKSFKHPHCLVSHLRTHTGEKPYKCDICKKRFSQSNSLVSHRKTHTEEKNIKKN